MIVTLLIWASIFLICYPYGKWLLKIWGKNLDNWHPIFVWLSGLALLTLLADVLSLFTNISLPVWAGITVGAVILWGMLWRNGWRPGSLASLRKPSRWHVPVLALAFLLFVFVLDLTSRAAANPDTAIYHAQTIHWIELYKAVPGLANLHSRLAYNSNWLMANALFSYAWLGGQSFHVLPGLFVLLTLFYFISGLWQAADGDWKISVWGKIALIPLFFIVLPSEVSSPGTDLPAVLITWLILSELLALAERPEGAYGPGLFVLSGLAIFAVSLKLSVMPLLIIPAWLLYELLRRKQYRASLILLLSGMAIMAPWLARNVVLSGYLIYPLPQVDLFNVDWKFPAFEAGGEVVAIQNWARHSWSDALQHSVSLPPQEWIPLWFKKETLNRRVLIVIVGAGIVLESLALCLPAARRLLSRWAKRDYLPVYLASFLGCLYWFLTAPDFRFGYSFILFSFVLIFLPVTRLLRRINFAARRGLSMGLVALLLVFHGALYAASFEGKSLSERAVMPVPYAVMPSNSCQFKGFSVWCAELYNQCWYDPFPCVPRIIPNVEMRGSNYEDGFRDTGN